MSFLYKARKAELVALAEDLGEQITAESTKSDIIKVISKSAEFEEGVVKDMLDSITEVMREQKEREDKLMREQMEREDKLMREQMEREDKHMREQQKREDMREQREHELKMEELKLKRNQNENRGERNESHIISNPNDQLLKYLNLIKDQLPIAPRRTENWVFFFHQTETIFEIYEIPEELRGKIILHRLADLIRSLTNSLGVDKLTNYKEIKECILAENRLTPLQYKNNFEKCTKRDVETYIQWTSRVRTNLDYYLSSREVNELNELKELIVTDHIKELLPPNVKSHILIKEGSKWMRSIELASEIDTYVEAHGKAGIYEEKREFKERNSGRIPERRFRDPPQDKVQYANPGNRVGPRTGTSVGLRCFECNELGHYRTECPRLKPQRAVEVSVNQVWVQATVNSLEQRNEKGTESGLPTVDIKVNGKRVEAIIDSGAQVSTFHTEVISEELKNMGSIQIVPAIGKGTRASLAIVSVALWEETHASQETQIVAAVTKELNCQALITPEVFEMLKNQQNFDTVSTDYGKNEPKPGVHMGRDPGVSENSESGQERELAEIREQEKVPERKGEKAKVNDPGENFVIRAKTVKRESRVREMWGMSEATGGPDAIGFDAELEEKEAPIELPVGAREPEAGAKLVDLRDWEINKGIISAETNQGDETKRNQTMVKCPIPTEYIDPYKTGIG